VSTVCGCPATVMRIGSVAWSIWMFTCGRAEHRPINKVLIQRCVPPDKHSWLNQQFTRSSSLGVETGAAQLHALWQRSPERTSLTYNATQDIRGGLCSP
jgi:hypothetical protein